MNTKPAKPAETPETKTPEERRDTKIRLITPLAGLNFDHRHGEVITVSKSEAERHIAGGNAVAYTETASNNGEVAELKAKLERSEKETDQVKAEAISAIKRLVDERDAAEKVAQDARAELAAMKAAATESAKSGGVPETATTNTPETATAPKPQTPKQPKAR